MLRRLLILLALLVAPALASARTNAIQPELVAEGPAVPGGEVELAILMHTQPGWHGYWLNPGDAGVPMAVQWQLPPGASVGALRYPVPTRLEIAGLMNYVYERDYAVLVRLKVPAAATGQLPIRASATWLACTDKICVPESGEFSLDLPTGGLATMDTRFNEWRRALPRPLATVAHFAVAGDKLQVAVALPASVTIGQPYLFPITDNAVDYDAAQGFHRSGDTLVAELQRKGAAPAQFSGVLALGDGRGLEFHAVPGPVPDGGTTVGGLDATAMLWALLGAIAGGILLNLMPCVFPILALKALHLSRAGGSAREARSDALAYAAGTIVGTGALGAVLLAIRAAGAEAGWAFQLQDPRTMLLLLLLAVAITANLLGLFELPVLGGGAQPAGSLGSGALAAFVATPCAGPFLGAALGTALLLPPVGAVAVFAALGLGLALPFVAIALIPALRTKLPKPGRWMNRLKRFLAIPMAASAVAVLWLLYRQAGTTALWLGIAAVVGLLLLLFGAGQRQRSGRGAIWTLPVALALGGLLIVVLPTASSSVRASSSAETWSEAKVAASVASHKPLFVYFTADWCLTCKVNEAAAIDRSEVRDAFKQAGVTVLAGDWTNGDPAITRFLESRGRAGVPLYLWYAPGQPPEELPQVLTPAMLTSRARALKV
jgi:DsbC/DsbD-like thiol-disulfide interchange protein/cytochrome c biogenesis protein CcdA